MSRFQLTRNLAASNTYQRFLRVPTVIAFLLVLVSWVMMTSYTFLFIYGITPYPLIDLVAVLFLSCICYPVILWFVFSEAHSAMIRRRLWIWGQNKFNSWPEFSDWINKTHHLALDHIAGLPDDSWYPDMKRGGMER